MKRLTLVLALLCLAMIANADAITGKQALAELRKFGSELTNPAERESNQTKYVAKAKELIGELKVADIPVEEAADWAAIFEAAGKSEDALVLNKKAFAYLGNSARIVQDNLIRSYIQAEKFDELLALLKRPVDVLGAAVIGQMSESIRYGLDKYRTSKPELLLKCYDLLLDQIHPERAISGDDKNWEPYVYSSISCLKYELMLDQGKKAEAIKGLKALRKKMEAYPNSKNAFGQVATYPVDTLLKKAELSNAIAPRIVVDNKIGNFTSLEAWRGKVVIVDFFAHWCGPCIRSFPTLKQYIADYGSNGLEVVGVTSYYGYYGQAKDVSRVDEHAMVKSKFLVEHKMSWPVVFDAKQITQSSFAVQAIPHMTIVDRKGKIRHVEVGYNPNHEAAIRKLIEECLAEK